MEDPKPPASTEATRFTVPKRADPQIEVDHGDELTAIQEEIAHTQHPGYQRRTDWLQWRYQKIAEDLALGRITDERERHHLEGRCQMVKEIYDRDLLLADRVKELTAADPKDEDRGDEGGDLGVNYEASR